MGADGHRVSLHTLGCKVNRTESEALAEALIGAGVEVVMDDTEAELVVVNTCTVTGEADAKARKAVRRSLSGGARAVVVTGCLAAIDPEGLASLDARVVVEPDRRKLPSRIGSLLGRTLDGPGVERRGKVFRTRVMVKVQDGCDHRCSYCIVPDARGLPVSVPLGEVLDRVTALKSAGTAEVVLTGINIGRYSGASASGGLGRLVEAVASTGIPRIRISSIEPLDLTDELLRILSRMPQFVRHLHVPLQSGSDAILKRMRRGYDTATYADVLGRAREALPGVAVTTDVMVGFAGETDDDFAGSFEFVSNAAFAKLHVFRYSLRAGTPAASMPDHVPPGIKSQRAALMRGLSDRLSKAHMDSMIGKDATLCVERVEQGRAFGMSDRALRVELDSAGVAPGDVVRVRVDAANESGLLGTMLESA